MSAIRIGLLVSAFAIAAAVAGCGGSSDEDAVVDQVEAFRTAIVDGDGAAACALMTESAQDVYANIGKAGTCEGGVEQIAGAVDTSQFDTPVESDDVSIDGDIATVTVGGEPTIALVKTDDEWLIDNPGD